MLIAKGVSWLRTLAPQVKGVSWFLTQTQRPILPQSLIIITIIVVIILILIIIVSNASWEAGGRKQRKGFKHTNTQTHNG